MKVDGGQVCYIDVFVVLIQFYSSVGMVYMLNNVFKDFVYMVIVNVGISKVCYDCWGLMVSYGVIGFVWLEGGYVEG